MMKWIAALAVLLAVSALHAGQPRLDRAGDPLPPGAVARLGTTRFRMRMYDPLAFSPDGKFIAIGAEDAAVLVDAASGKRLRRLVGGKPVHALAFSPDGRKLAALEAGLIRVWDTRTGRAFLGLNGDIELGHGEQPRLVFAPDGKTLAAEHGTHTGVHLWDVAAGKERWQAGRVFFPLGYGPGGKTLIADGHDIISLDVSTGQERRRVQLPQALTGSRMILSPDGTTLAVANHLSHPPQVILWDLKRGKELRTFRGETPFAFSRDGRLLAARDANRILVREVTTGKIVGRLSGDIGRAEWVSVFADNSTLAFRRATETVIRFWDVRRDVELHPPPGHRSHVQSLAFRPDGKTLVSTALDGTVRLWETATGKEIRCHAELEGSRWWSTALSADGKVLVSCNHVDQKLRRRDALTGKELRRPIDKQDTETCLTLSPDGRLMAFGTADVSDRFELRMWSLSTGKELLRTPHRWRPVSVAFSPDGKLLAAADSFTVSLRATDTGRERWTVTLPRPIDAECLAFSPDGKTVACGAWRWDGKRETDGVLLWETATGRARLSADSLPGRILCLTFSPDGRLLATGERDHQVRLWDARTGKHLRRLEGHQNAVTVLAFSPDGKQLASGSLDTTILVWDTADLSGRPTPRMECRPRDLEAAWRDLAGADTARAYRAIGVLSRARSGVAFLREHVRPAVKLDPGQVRKQIADLDHDRFAVRSQAARELAELGRAAEPLLRQALAARPTLEARRRIEVLLKQLDGPVTAPEALRELRTVEALEHAGTAESRELLRALASGEPQARRTHAAREALRRLERKPEPR